MWSKGHEGLWINRCFLHVVHFHYIEVELEDLITKNLSTATSLAPYCKTGANTMLQDTRTRIRNDGDSVDLHSHMECPINKPVHSPGTLQLQGPSSEIFIEKFVRRIRMILQAAPAETTDVHHIQS